MGGGMYGLGGMGAPPVTPAATSANWGDIGMLDAGFGSSTPAAPTIDYGQLDSSSKDDGIDWGILGDNPADAGGAAAGRGAAKKTDAPQQDDEDDEEFAVFDGFQDGRAVLGGEKPGAKRAQKAGEGLSWDAERGLWKETKPRSAFGSGFGNSWDLRGAGAAMRSPASLLRIRSQAEKIFNDNVSNSLFTSPTMQRFKQQTDDMFASLSAYVPTSVFRETKSFFSSWFG